MSKSIIDKIKHLNQYYVEQLLMKHNYNDSTFILQRHDADDGLLVGQRMVFSRLGHEYVKIYTFANVMNKNSKPIIETYKIKQARKIWRNYKSNNFTEIKKV